jgi:bifunctional DNase/RNase
VSIKALTPDAETKVATFLERDGATIHMSCHPADALAVAVRTSSPIYATVAAMDHACRVDAGHGRAARGFWTM